MAGRARPAPFPLCPSTPILSRWRVGLTRQDARVKSKKAPVSAAASWKLAATGSQSAFFMSTVDGPCRQVPVALKREP